MMSKAGIANRHWGVFAVAALLAALLAGCGGNSTPTVPPTPKEVAVTTTPEITLSLSVAPATPPPLASPRPRPMPSNSTPGTSAPAGPTPTSDPRAVPIATAALKQMQGYHSFHFTAVTSDTSQTTTIEGDYVAPDRLSVQTTLGGTSVQQIVIGSDVYLNSGNGWTKSNVDASALLSLARLWNTVVAVNGVTLVGDEPSGGQPATHLRVSADVADTASLPGGATGQAGRLSVDSWISKRDNAVLRISLTTNVVGQTAYRVETNYSDFNKQVEVKAPSPLEEHERHPPLYNQFVI